VVKNVFPNDPHPACAACRSSACPSPAPAGEGIEFYLSEGHEVESMRALRMQGLDNGGLYRFAMENVELCFTRDFGFANNVQRGTVPEKFKLLRVTLPQKPQDESIADFLAAFAPRI
jgi:hypothetical protein